MGKRMGRIAVVVAVPAVVLSGALVISPRLHPATEQTALETPVTPIPASPAAAEPPTGDGLVQLPDETLLALGERPAVVPAPDPQMQAGIDAAAAASVNWTVPKERRALGDAVPGEEPAGEAAPRRPVIIAGCPNQLVQLLAGVGFRGEDLREAWSIAMRESGGREEANRKGIDWGLFQLNKPTFGGQRWWNDQAVLNGEYNARVAYYLSQGGRTWYPWGLDGHGNTNAGAYDSIWTPEQIYAWITKPYQEWYAKFPCA